VTLTIKWTSTDKNSPAKECLFLIVSAAGQPPDAKLMDKSEVEIGQWKPSRRRLNLSRRRSRIFL
jgi:hypothetical protein